MPSKTDFRHGKGIFSMVFKPTSVGIVGLGLIGGSIGLALKAKTQLSIYGFDVDTSVAKRALEIGAIDSYVQKLEDIGLQANLIFIAAPIAQTSQTIKNLLPFLSPGAIVTDVASVKWGIVNEVEKELFNKNITFIAGHPMAGKETQGVDTADPKLFEGRPWVLIHNDNVSIKDYKEIEKIIALMGAETIRLDAETHDMAVASVSHLPLLVANTLLETVVENQLWDISSRLAAGGFRDTTRLASGNPQLHKDIVCANREKILFALSELEEKLREIRRLIESKDDENLVKFFEKNKNMRDQWYGSNFL
jgi:prephenate dehydrogenase